MIEEDKIEQQLKPQRIEWKKLLSYQWIVKNIPFFFFLATLAVLYIYNGDYADKMARNINTTERNIKELEYEYKTIESEVIFHSKASELEKVVEPLGLKALIKPPVKLENDAVADSGRSDEPHL
jgi:hypothetical protein